MMEVMGGGSMGTFLQNNLDVILLGFGEVIWDG